MAVLIPRACMIARPFLLRLTLVTKIEAIPTIIMAAVILFFLPSFPFSASFLTLRERAIAQARLNGDHKPQSHGGMTGWQGFKAVISDLNAWLFMLIYASCTPPTLSN